MNDKELFAKYIEKMDSFHDENFSNMANDLLKGQNSYFRMKFKGSSVFNPSWIKKIEDCLYELGQIINNPREVTTEEGAVMPIELAKKINGESVQHLASHSQYIKEIAEDGSVVPAKILGQYSKEEIHTYENRFIATFIRRLILFVEKRYEFIKNVVNLAEKDVMYIKNKSIVNGQEVEIETKISVKRETEDELAKSARDYIARIEKLEEYVSYYYNSPFMREFKTEKDVKKPIIQTNILRKNPLYSKCYDTFVFIEKFDSLGVAYKADRKYQEFTAKQRKDLNYLLLSSLLSLESTEETRAYKKTSKVYKPRILPSIDDEIFTYGDLVRGPIEFVRSDAAYLEYKKNSAPKDLPLHPNAAEKQYYQAEYDERKAIKKDVEEVEALLARVRRQIAKYEKLVDKYVAKRNIEEAEQAKLELARLKKQEQDILNQKRKEIITAAKLEDVKEVEPVVEEQPIVEEKVEEPIIEEQPIEEPVEEAAPEEIPEPVVEEPVQEPEPVVETQPVEEAPVEEPAPVEEASVEEEPQEEVKEEPVVEPAPIVEEQPAEEEKIEEIPEVKEEVQPEPEPEPKPVVEAPVEEPVKAEEPKVEEKPAKAEKKAKSAKKSVKKAPAKKVAKPKEKAPAPVKEEPKKEEKKVAPKKAPVKKAAPKKEEKPAPKKEPVKKPEPKKAPEKKPAPQKEERKAIPGRFIVKLEDGYYVNSKKLSKEKGDAFIFDDFNKAQDIKSRLGGKIVKL